MKFHTKEILFEAFKIFLEKGYLGTTISLIQKKMGMSRGALYRHFTNKDDLYREVIEEYIFRTFERMLRGANSDYSVKELIDFVYQKTILTIDVAIRSGMDHLQYLNYSVLMYDAAKFFPGFTPRFRKLQQKITDGWIYTLEKGKMTGEINQNIDSHHIANIFYDIIMGEMRDDKKVGTFKEYLYSCAKDKNLRLMALYGLIKKNQ